MERLSGLDAAFLALETPADHMHVMAVAVLDPRTSPGGFTAATVKRLVEERLPNIPAFRRRIVEVPFNLHHPLWVEDPDFDLDYHVRQMAVIAPGGTRELAALVGDIASWPLDRTRPLWQLWVVEGLEDGNVGLIAKVHHSAIDGAAGVDVLAQLVDLEPVQPAVDRDDLEPWRPDRVPSDIEMIVGSMVSIAKRPVQMARAGLHLTRGLVRLGQRAREGSMSGGAAPFTAPRLTWNGSITPHRKVAFATISLADVKEVKDAFGVTVNDVVLAMVAGSLRRYLEARDELPDRPLVAVVPTNERTESTRGVVGNVVSAMFASLPSEQADPVARLAAVAESMSVAKQTHKDIGGTLLGEWAEVATAPILHNGIQLYRRFADRVRPIHNLVISNVPGPPVPVYMAGAQVVSLVPMGPIFDGAGLNVTVLSYLDRVDVGFMACRETVPGVWGMATAVPDAMAELVAAARAAAAGERHEELDEPAAAVTVEVDLTDVVPAVAADGYPDAG
ncbi:MAG: WS/DGAT/MGAT family O-acyltransferase [Actinomycetes bacterium]